MTQNEVTVYFVDDDAAMRDAVCFLLEEAGLPVKAFASGEEFLNAKGAEANGCVILDLRMPGMDGMEVYRELRRRGSVIPVIVLTGHGEVSGAVTAMKAGAFDYLMKPVHREELLERVQSALATVRAARDKCCEESDVRKMLAKLSLREQEVLREVAAGNSSKRIAMSMGISERTIANHRAHFMRKMKASNAADLVRKMSLLGPLDTNFTER